MSSPMVVTSGQQYKIVENPTIRLYTYIYHHAEPPNIFKRVAIIYDNRAIEPYKNRGFGQQ